MRFIDYLDKSASLYPDRPFIVMHDEVIRYREAASISNRIANALREKNVRTGDRAVVFAAHGPAACLAILGLLRAGCVLATIDASDDAGPIAANLQRLGVGVVIYDGKYKDRIESIESRGESFRCALELASTGKDAFEAHIAGKSDVFIEDGAWSPEDTATLFASGGSSGRVRNAVATHRCWETGIANLLAIAPEEGVVQGLVLPMTHIAGVTGFLFSMSRAGTLVLMEKFDPDYVGYLVAKHRISFLVLAPTALRMMLAHPKVRAFDFSSLRTLLYSGGPSLTSSILEAIEVFGPVLVTSYGQTETTVPVAALLQNDHARAFASGNEALLASCGRTLPLSRVEIMDESGELLSHGEVGEIVVRAPHVMTGYYHNPEDTAEISRFGWHHTGDLGRMDDEGYLYIVDRKREMIITGGYNVFPRQIEDVLLSHPSVRECVVVGAPHDVLGEVVKAVVVLNPDPPVTANALKAWCMSKLGPVRTPTSIDFWEQLPLTGAGKVARAAVREEYWQGRARKI